MFPGSYRFYLLLTLVFFPSFSKAQEFDVVIEWKAPERIVFEGNEIFTPDFEGREFDKGRPILFRKGKLKSKNYIIRLQDYVTEPADANDLNYMNSVGYKVSNEIQCEYQVTDDGRDHYWVIQLFPYVTENNVLKRISSIRFELVPSVQQAELIEKDFATQSVLREGSGYWYKISVRNDAIYKIDKTFLEACGINTTGLNPDHIHIYGNGDGKLPEVNSIERTDDLAKNAIFISGDADGSFDDGDYILFYGLGPHRWYPNGVTSFEQDRNIYSDISCYFININSSESPLRITDLSPSGLTPTHTINSYSFYDIVETDQVSLVKGGQRWYGDLFDTELERTYTFSVPNIVSSTAANFKVSMATNARSSSGTQQRYSVNSVELYSATLPNVTIDWVRQEHNLNLNNPGTSIPFKISITRNNPSVLVYLDRILMNARRSLTFYGSQMKFRDLSSFGSGNVGEFNVSSFPSSGFVWDVTDRHQPKRVGGTLSGSTFSFVQNIDTLREFIVSNGLNFQIPDKIGQVSFQNLHGYDQADLLIVTHKDFLIQANRLADLHRSEGLSVNVATTEQVYNEFSSGMLDPTAIRMFAKMFYDRASVDPANELKNLILFGDGTYDPKNRVSNNNNYIPTYQFQISENHISAMVSDDYYAMLSDSDGMLATDLMDIGVGRILATDQTTARQQVDKIEHYMKNGSALYGGSGSGMNCSTGGPVSTFGDWRMNYVQIADDEEGGYFMNIDTEPQYEAVKSDHPDMNCDKLYLDAYTQMTTAGGQRYPDVFEGITDRVERGALVVNYVGHGGEVGLAEERVVTIPQIQVWENIHKLNVFVSATCEFTKYDDPSRVSAGEWVALNPTGGAVALMTTSRSVYFGVNTLTGQRFFETVFDRDAQNKPLQLGEIMRITKNLSGSSDNKRSFTLIGDPALRIALPEMKVVTDSVNGLSPVIEMDTLKALSKVTIKGHLEDYDGNVLSGFNGVLSPTLFDKPKIQNTLGQDPSSPVIPFEIQKNIVYKGKATVTNGYFEFTFVVPKDISLSYGRGKISYYAENGSFDAGGSDDRFVIGGIDPNGINDQQGPDIKLMLNDENFVNGGITDETPVLIADLFDENGINTVGNGIGHDLTAILDGNTADPYVLNDYYVADMDSYQSGKITFQMPALEKGKHTLTVKVWDVNNNSSQETIEFTVQEKEEVALEHVLNYPNPFTTHTEFFFEHNQVCSQMETQVQIMTVSGRVVKTINETVETEGFRSAGIPWDGKDEFGDQLAKGVYLYWIKVKTPEGGTAEKLEKLVLLK